MKGGKLLPKIIENVKEQLLEEVRKEIESVGYAGTTIRSVAKGCGVGVGTVYNYFKSKEMLIASVVAEDWHLCLNDFKSSPPKAPKDTLKNLYDMLIAFSSEHKNIFRDPQAVKKFFSEFLENHEILRNQIAELILPLCIKNENPEFLSKFIGESLLTWSMARVPFEDYYSVIKKLI